MPSYVTNFKYEYIFILIELVCPKFLQAYSIIIIETGSHDGSRSVALRSVALHILIILFWDL